MCASESGEKGAASLSHLAWGREAPTLPHGQRALPALRSPLVPVWGGSGHHRMPCCISMRRLGCSFFSPFSVSYPSPSISVPHPSPATEKTGPCKKGSFPTLCGPFFVLGWGPLNAPFLPFVCSAVGLLSQPGPFPSLCPPPSLCAPDPPGNFPMEESPDAGRGERLCSDCRENGGGKKQQPSDKKRL